MHRLSSAFVLGYHGCSSPVAERLLSGTSGFLPSDNDYDWLGPGIYFWQSNPLRALQFAREKSAREAASWEPSVLGAVIDLGLCLDLSTEACVTIVARAFEVLKATMDAAGEELPSNRGGPDKLLRRLDCAVVRQLHDIRREAGEVPVTTVRGVFVEGDPVFEGSGFRSKTHVQICVCEPAAIRGMFRVPDSDMNLD